MIPQDKTSIRNELRNKRRTLPKEIREEAAVKAADLLIKSTIFLTSKKIAVYFSNENELDCNVIIKTIWDQQKECYLPILLSDKKLSFAMYTNETPLKKNRYGINEPDTITNLSAQEMDLVLLPLVAFDLEGNRVGMGGGYYDRTFQFRLTPTTNKPFLVGLAYENQSVSKLPRDEWDVPLDAVLTEHKMRFFNSSWVDKV